MTRKKFSDVVGMTYRAPNESLALLRAHGFASAADQIALAEMRASKITEAGALRDPGKNAIPHADIVAALLSLEQEFDHANMFAAGTLLAATGIGWTDDEATRLAIKSRRERSFHALSRIAVTGQIKCNGAGRHWAAITRALGDVANAVPLEPSAREEFPHMESFFTALRKKRKSGGL